LQAVIGDDALDRAQADGEVSLAQLLGDDVGGGVGVQEEVAQDLADGLVGAAVVGLGTFFLGLEGQEAAVLEAVQELIIAGTGEAVFVGDGADAGLEALAFEEHEEAAGEVVGAVDVEGTGWAGDLVVGEIEVER
jgi:hypothetical protein